MSALQPIATAGPVMQSGEAVLTWSKEGGYAVAVWRPRSDPRRRWPDEGWCIASEMVFPSDDCGLLHDPTDWMRLPEARCSRDAT